MGAKVACRSQALKLSGKVGDTGVFRLYEGVKTVSFGDNQSLRGELLLQNGF